MIWFLIFLRGWIWATPENPSPFEWVESVNRVRAKGCWCGLTYMPPSAPVTWDPTLAKIAQAHSQDMANARFFNHQSPSTGSPADRLKRAGVNWQVWAENLFKAQGYSPTAQEVIDAWVKSPSHCKSLLQAQVTQMGVGRWRGLYTQLLIRPQTGK